MGAGRLRGPDDRAPCAGLLRLALGAYRVGVEGSDDALASWLTEVLQPGVAAVSPGGSDASVTVRSVAGGAPRFVGSRLVPCFALDRGLRWLPGAVVDGCLEVHDDAYGARFRVRERVVEVDVTGEDLAPRIAIFRVVRELLLAGALSRQRAVQLHASGVVLDGEAVLFVGPKRSGKTTLAAHLAIATGASLMANDRVAVRRGDRGRLWAVGLPSIVSVRSGTRELLPRLAARLPVAAHAARRSLAELPGAPPAPGGNERRFTLLQVARAAGVALASAAPLKAIAVVSVDDGVDVADVRAVHPASALTRLAAVRFGAATEPRPATVFEEAVGSRAVDDRVLLEEVAGSVPVVEVRAGAGLLASESAAVRLAAMLAGR